MSSSPRVDFWAMPSTPERGPLGHGLMLLPVMESLYNLKGVHLAYGIMLSPIIGISIACYTRECYALWPGLKNLGQQKAHLSAPHR